MSFSSLLRSYFKNWLSGKKKQRPIRNRRNHQQLYVELLEDRTVMSALPAAVVGSPAFQLQTLAPAVWGGSSIRTQSTSPSVIVDPLNPDKIVEVHATFLTTDLVPGTNHPLIYGDDPGSPSVTGIPSSLNTPQWVIEGSYSNDEGRTWNWFSVSQAITDPALIGLAPGLGYEPYTLISDVSAAFDRNNHFYVVSLQQNQPGVGVSANQSHTSGAIVEQRFDFTGSAPVKDMTLGADPANLGLGTYSPGLSDPFSPGSAVIYQWYDQDPAANPIIAIDDNVPTFTDPTTGAVQTDSLATMVSIPATEAYPADLVPKAIYVAYNTQQTYPQPNNIIDPIKLESRVFMVASADGGHTFTNQELVSDREQYYNAISPVTGGVINPDQSGTEASDPQIVFSQGSAQRPGFFTYNGEKSSSFAFDIANATTSQILSVLDSIPLLNGNVAVTYIGGASGNLSQNVSGATFSITFLNGTTPYLLTYDGPGSLNTTSATVDSFTGITASAGGQLMVFYNDFFNGFNRIYYDITRPDGGIAAAPVAASSIFSSPLETLITDNGVTDDPVPVDFSTTGIDGINNLTSVDDLTVTVNIVDPDLDQLSLVLIPPNGLPEVNLLLNRVDTSGKTIRPDGTNNHQQGLPSSGNSSLGEIPVPTNPVTYEPVGTVFDDNAPRVITDGQDGFPWTVTVADPYIGHFQPEEDNTDFIDFPGYLTESALLIGPTSTTIPPLMGALTALINTPNFIALSKGNWVLEATDTRTSKNAVQYIQSWSLNFTGDIATTQGSPGNGFPDYTGAPGEGTPGAIEGFPGGVSGFGVDLPLATPFPLPISPDSPGAPNTTITTLPGAFDNTYPTNTPVSPAGTPGIAPTFSVAIDNTLGSFSPFQGRVYVAITVGTGANTSIELVTSDDPTGAAPGSISPSTFVGVNFFSETGSLSSGPFATTTDHWTVEPALGQLDNNAAGDDFTGTNFAMFNPQIAVDPVTGTLGVTWYDGRFDAQHVRIVNAFSTSIDGGVTFAPDAFLNTEQTATDFYTGDPVPLEPIPDNLTVAGALGFGQRTGLAMYDGRVYPFWSGNLDVAGSEIFTNTVTVAGGPRLLSGDMGPVVGDFNQDGVSYNNTYAADGTQQLNGFILTFDRPVDPGTVTPNIINITYRDPNTAAGSPGTDISNQITSITPLDLSASHGPNDSGTPPSFSISDTIVQEPGTGQTMALFTVILSQAQGTPVAVNWATQDATGNGAAVSTGPNADYVPSSGTVVFQPGALTASFQVPVLSDTLLTSNRYFLVNLFNAPGAIVIDRAQGKGTIVADQNIPTLTVGNSYVLKNATGSFSYNGQASTVITLEPSTNAAQITSILNTIAALSGKVTVTGSAGGPFTLTFAGGTTSSLLTFSVPGLLTASAAATATLTINPIMNFPVYLNAPAATNVTVDFSFADGTAVNGKDYSGVPGTLTILKGNTMGIITATVISNQLNTGNLNFFVNLTNPVNASVTRSQVVGVIVDDNPLTVTSGNLTVQRAATAQPANVTFYLNGVTNQDVTVTYQTVNGTAVAGKDFTAVVGGTAIIHAGSQSVTVPITIAGSTTPSIDKSFTVTITAVQNASFNPANSSSTVTIVDDNLMPAVIIGNAISRQGITGNNQVVNVPIFLSFANPSPITLSIQTTSAGPNPTAIAGTDYVAIPASTTITIQPGSSVVDSAGNTVPGINVPVTLVGNLLPETPINPTFGLQVNSVVTGNATIDRSVGIVTIVSDYVQATVGDGQMVREPGAGTATMVFPVFLSGPSELPITLAVHTVDGTAVAGQDYTSTTSTVTFAPGEVEKLVSVPILHNPGSNAQPHTFTLAATAMTVGGQPAPALIEAPGTGGNPTGTGSIVDVDGANIIGGVTTAFWDIGDVSQFVPNFTNNTGGGLVTMSFPIIVSQAFTTAQTIFVTTAYTGTSLGITPITNTVFTLPAGNTSVIVPVTVLTDPNTTGNQTFTVTLTAASAGTISKGTGIGTLVYENADTLNVGSATGDVPQNNPATFNFPIVVANKLTTLVDTNVVLASGVNLPVVTSNGTPNFVFGAYSALDGTATLLENDYLPVNEAIFENTTDTFTVPVTVNPTTTAELTDPGFETFNVVLDPAITNINVNPPQTTATGYMIDDNVLNLSAGDTSVQDTPAGATMNFRVYLNGISGSATTFSWNLQDGSAKAAVNYKGPTSGTATIPKGALFTTISVPILPESSSGANQNLSFTLSISNPVGAGLQKNLATGTIMNNVLTPTLTISDAIVKKQSSGQQNATFTVFSNFPVATPTTFTITPSDLTASAAKGDYVNTPFNVTLPAGATSVTFNIPINGNSTAEGNLTFRATLSNPSNGDLIAPRIADQDKGALGEGIATIVDFNSVSSLNIGDLVVTEGFYGQQTDSIPVILSAPSAVPITVQVDTSDGTATAAHHDYLPIVGLKVTIPANTTTFNIPVTIYGSSVFDGDRNFFVTLSNAVGATVNKASATVTIVDPNGVMGATQFLVNLKPQSAVGTYSYTVQPLVSDRIRMPSFQGGPELTIGNVTLQDDATQATFTLVLNAASSQTVTALVNTHDATAHAGTDYTALVNQLVTFAPGVTTATVSVPITSIGTTIEPLRTFTLTGSNLTVGGSLAPASSIVDAGTASIVDQNDASNTFWSIGDAIATGGPTSSVTFTIFTNKPFAANQTIDVTTSGGSGDIASLINVPVTLLAGQTSTTVTIQVNTGQILAANLAFTVTLSSPSSGVLGQKKVGTAQIVANIPFDTTIGPTLTVGDVTLTDNDAAANFTLELSAPSSQAVTVLVNTSDGSALAGTDYTAVVNRLVTFAPGTTTQTVSVPVTAVGTTIEPFRTFTLTASDLVVGGVTSPGSAIVDAGTASIVDQHDASDTFWSVNDVITPAGPTASVTFTIFTNQAFATDQTILVTTAGVAANFVSPLISVPVTLLAGSTFTTVTIPVNTGLTLASNLSFTLTLSSPSSGDLGQKPVGTAFIVANSTFDPTRLSSTPLNWQAVVPVSITEGNAVPAQQNLPINTASLPAPPSTPSVPSVTTSTINISGINSAQVLRDMTVTVNAEFPDTTGLLVQLIAPNNGPTYTLARNEPGTNFPNTVFDDQALNAISERTASSVQTITVDATGGSFTLSFNSSLASVALPAGATAAAVQTALQNLITIGAGHVSVTAVGEVYTVVLTGFDNPPLIVADGNPLTGKTHSATVAAVLPQGVSASFRPETPLSADPLPASELNGTWTLKITNTSTANFGTLTNWSLRLQTGLLSSALTPLDPSYYGSLGNAMNQVQNGFTANMTRDPTDIFAVPMPVDGVPLSITAPYLSPPYDPNTLPLIIPGPHQDVLKYTTANVTQTLNFGTGITGGTFTLTFNGKTTGAINWSANPTILQGNIQAALTTLATVGQGNMVVSAAANPTVTYENALSGFSEPGLTFNASGLTGGTLVSITSATIGTPTNPLDFPIPEGTRNLSTNAVTPGVINVPLVIANAPSAQVLTGLTVRLDIQHPFDADLRISLIAPNGTTVLLSDQNGPGQGNFDGTTFDDNASVAIGAGSGPFHGTYVPDQPLSAFNGLNVNGTWTLRVQDMQADGQNGQVLWWQLIPTSGLILNQTNSYVDVFFDRQINASTINASNITNMLGPTGPIPFSDTISFSGSGNVTLAYNGNKATTPAYAFSAGTTTAAQFAAYLASLPGLSALTAAEVTGANGGPFTIAFPSSVLGGNLLTVVSGPATIAPVVAVTANPTNDTLSFGGTGTVTLAYNGLKASSPAFSYTAATTTAGQLAAYLATIPGLTALTTASVTGPNGGPFTVSVPVSSLLTVVSGSASIGSIAVYPPEYTNRVFRISFPTQQLSGSYSLVVGPVNNTINPALNKPIDDLNGNAIDNNLNAGLYVSRGVDPTDAATVFSSYSSGVINQVFPAASTEFSTIVVPDDYIITQDDINHIQVQIILTHPNTPDLIATLTAPDGTVVKLFSNVGIYGAVAGSQHPDSGSVTVLDDFAANPIQNASIGIAGTYKPQLPLSDLVGKNAKGTWSLTIKNQAKNAANSFSIGTFSGTLNRWTLTFPHSVPGTGLGETGADQINVGFRIFTESTTNTLSSTVWAPIGPAPETGSQTGPMGAITVDPADPSGNTVYAAGSSGGIWKTYDFLTTNPDGPNWIPLTDLGPLDGLNINTMTAVASPDGDPNKTIIMAGTGTALAGSPNTTTSDGLPLSLSGIGFLRSIDGGRSWQVIDSLSNNVTVNPTTQVQTAVPIDSASRDHTFDGTVINKVVIDPNPVSGVFTMYAAVSGTTTTNSGLFRSSDSGLTWVQIESGLCTDVVLAGGSGTNGGTGPLQVLYAGFMTGLGRTGGVYFTSSASGAPLGQNSLLPVPNNGSGAPGANQGVNSRVDISNLAAPAPYPTISVGPSTNPSNATTPIILATPAKTNNPLEDSLYQGWVYAYVDGTLANNVATSGTLYESKDFGANWTLVNLPITSIATNPVVPPDLPTNDTTKPNFGFTSAKSIIIDPSDPNIIYIGGNDPFPYHNLGVNNGFFGTAKEGFGSSVVRVDLTDVNDVYSFVNYNYGAATGPTAQNFSVGAVNNGGFAGATGPAYVLNDFSGLPSTNVLSMLRDPSNPFLSPSALQFTQALNFSNNGSDIHWQYFDFGEGDVNQMVDIVDPATGNLRLFSATSTGVYTGVDLGAGNIDPGIGSDVSVSGDRIGNLQIAQITETGAEPSTLAANVAGALLFAENPGIGTPMSDPNIFQDGNITWNNLSAGFGEDIAADPTGSGTVYRYQYPYTANYPVNPTGTFSNLTGSDFFQVNPPGTLPTADDPSASGTSSATTGLIRAGDFPSTTGAGEWPGPGISPTGIVWENPQPVNAENEGSNFAINPIGIPGDYQGMVMSSRAGRVFRASNNSLAAGVDGIVWQDIGDPGVAGGIQDGTYAPAVAFGSPAQGSNNVDNFIYVGTLGGHIYVTFAGGGTSWTDISTGLDGSPVLAISPDPARNGTDDAFALTQKGIYYCANSHAAAPTWVLLDDTSGKGYIFPNAAASQSGIMRPVWNNTNDETPAFNATSGLTSLAVDWRFAIPTTQNPNGSTPVLYVGGDGGVVTSTDFGKTWSLFPAFSSSAPGSQDGGYLPSVRVTDLTLILGNVNQVTGIPDTSTGLNMLVASTYGRGDFAIRLNNSAISTDVVIPNPGPEVASIAPLTGTFGENLTGITVTFKGAVDPTSFTPNSVDYVKDPSGHIVPVQYVFDVTPNTGSGDLHNIYQIVFATPQTANGAYSLLLGPNITDDSGNLMNQNGNTVNGEIGTPGSDDRFLGTVSFTANTAPVLSFIPTQISPPGVPLTVNFTVSDASNPAGSLLLMPAPTSSNTTLVPNGNISIGAISGPNGTGRSLTITPVGNQPGVTFITLNLTDPQGLMASPETFEVIFDTTPVITPVNPIGPQSIPHGKTLALQFSVSGVTTSTPTVSAVTISPIYNLWSLDKFFESGGSYSQNADGLNEKWVLSQTTGKWFIIQPNGTFSMWNGGKSFTPVTTDPAGNMLLLDNSYWQDPTKITAPAAPFNLSATVVGASPNWTLQVTAPLNFVGMAKVTVTATDSFATAAFSFPLTITNSPPQFNTIGTPAVTGGIPVLSAPPAQGSISLHIGDPAPGGYNLTDADDGVAGVTLDTSAVYAYNTASIAYELSQAFSLYFTGNYYTNSAGLNEKWVQSLTTLQWYIIQPSGAFSIWNGKKSFTQIATLDNSYWQNPTNLVQAPQPAALTSDLSVDDTTHYLTITPAGQYVVKVAAFDGQATTTKFFNTVVSSMPPVFSVPNQQFAHNAPSNPQLTIDLANQPGNPPGTVNLSDPNDLPVSSTITVYPAGSKTPLTSNAAFTFADNANVLTFNTNGTVAGNFTVSVTASDSLSSTTHTFSLSITDAAPSFNLSAPAPTTISHTGSYNATVNDIGDTDDGQAAVVVSANVFPYVPGFAYELQQTYQFFTAGNYYSTGTNPKWIRSAVNNGWYTIDKNGVVSQWNGGTSFTAVGTLNATYYADPTKLFGATQPTPLNPASVTVTFTGSNAAGYNLNVAPINAAGNLLVQVNASDGALTTSKYFPLTVISPTPSFTVTPAASSVAFTNTAAATVSNISAAPDAPSAVTFTASVYPLAPGLAFQLNQQKAFTFTGNYYLNLDGFDEKWLFSTVDNAWYTIEPDGTLSKWNGGKSFTQVVVDGVNVVLGSAYWNDPSLLYNANTAPADLAHGGGTFTTAFTGNNATGLTLTISTNNINQGSFLVQVVGNDSGATTSQYFVQKFTDFAPTFGQPADQAVSHYLHTFTLDLTNPASFANPTAVPAPTLFYAEGIPAGNLSTVTLSVKAYYDDAASIAYELNSQLNLFTTGNYFTNAAGLGEKWVRSHVTNLWYIIQPNGNFSVWNGGTSFTFVAQLDSTYFANPTTLFGATEPLGADQAQAPSFPTPAVTSYTVDNVNHTVTVNTTSSFVGTLIVKVTASDPTGLSSFQFFKLSFTSLPPTLSFNPAGTVALSKSGNVTVELVGNDPDSNNANPLTYTVAFTDASAPAQAYALQQSLNLYVSGSLYKNYYGFNEIWLRSHTTGAWYAITPDGAVHLLNTKQLLGPVVANLGSAYYTNYTLLLTAQPPAPLPITYQVSAANDLANPDAMNLLLTWNNPSVPASGVYPVEVTVTATNSVGASTKQSFAVDVS